MCTRESHAEQKSGLIHLGPSIGKQRLDESMVYDLRNCLKCGSTLAIEAQAHQNDCPDSAGSSPGAKSVHATPGLNGAARQARCTNARTE